MNGHGNKMNPKEKAIKILNTAKGNAKDNLFRAEREFYSLTDKEMQEQFYHSGYTKQQVLDSYKNEYDEIVAAIELIKGCK
jgi:hypothetical protein